MKPILNLDYECSLLLSYAYFAAVLFIGIVVSRHHKRMVLTAIGSALIAYIIVANQDNNLYVTAVIIACVAYILSVMLLIIYRRLDGSVRIGKASMRISGFCITALLVLMVLIFPCIDPGIAEEQIMGDVNVSAGSGSNGSGQIVPDIDWDHASDRDKLRYLCAIANEEAELLGIRQSKLTVENLNKGTDISGGYTLGSSSYSRATITIDKDYLHTGIQGDLIGTVCHEQYHQMQKAMVSLYEIAAKHDKGYKKLKCFEEANVPELKRNFDNYANGHTDYKEYEDLLCEQQARDYAEKRVVIYMGGKQDE